MKYTCNNCDKTFCESRLDPKYFEDCDYHSSGEINITRKNIKRFLPLIIIRICGILLFTASILWMMRSEWANENAWIAGIWFILFCMFNLFFK
jgi:hypothetical protein